MSKVSSFTATRRQVLAGGGALGTMAAVAGLPKMAVGAPPLRTRYAIGTPQGDLALKHYADAVLKMQDPAINTPPQPQSWTFQSYIHGVPENLTDPANSGGLMNGTAALNKRIDEIYGNPKAGTPQAQWKEAAKACWGSCPHGSAWFVSWHRWYIYYFEQIVGKLAGVKDYSLPYWSYGTTDPTSMQLPALFKDQKLALYFEDRGLGFANADGTGPQNVPMNEKGFMPYSQTNPAPSLEKLPIFPADTKFVDPSSAAFKRLGFAGRMEILPHDFVHVNVGGWMGNVPSAAGDPVFYVHHCQVDRLWASWGSYAGASYNWGHTSHHPSQRAWTQRKFQYVDANGALVTKLSGETVETAKLGYVYDSLVPQPAAAPALVLATAKAVEAPEATTSSLVAKAAQQADGLTVKGDGASARVKLAPVPRTQALAGAAPSAPAQLVLEDVRLRKRSKAPLYVFINLPEGATAELNSPYLVGMLELFRFDPGTGRPMQDAYGSPHGQHEGEPNFVYDVADILAKQKAAGQWDGKEVTVTVTTLGAPAGTNETLVTVGRVSLVP